MAENQEGVVVDINPDQKQSPSKFLNRIKERVKSQFRKPRVSPVTIANPDLSHQATRLHVDVTSIIPTEQPTNPTVIEQLEPVKPTIYRGLERLDELHENEPVLESFARMSPSPEVVEQCKVKLAKIGAERQAIYEQYDLIGTDDQYLKDDLDDNKYINAKAIAILLTNREVKKLPPLKKGYVRMFRGEGPHPGHTDDPDKGRWFSPWTSTAFTYPVGPLRDTRIIYVDIPNTNAGKYHYDDIEGNRGAGKTGEYLLPGDDIDRAQEFVRFLRTKTTDDPWAKIVAQR